MDTSVYDQLEASIDVVCERCDDGDAWHAVLGALAAACGQPALRYEVWRDDDGPVHSIGSDGAGCAELADAQVLVGAGGLTAQLIHSRDLLRTAAPEQRAVWSLAGSRLATAARAHLQVMAVRLAAEDAARREELPFLVVGRGGVVRINSAMRGWIGAHPAWLRLVGRQLEDPRHAIERLCVGLGAAARVALPLGADASGADAAPVSFVALPWPAAGGTLLLLLAQEGGVRSLPRALDAAAPFDAATRALLGDIAGGASLDALVERHAVVRMPARAALRSTVPVRAPAGLHDVAAVAANASVLDLGAGASACASGAG
ncbi:hypothetical protein [Derxia lacustris]|uniref:hypothetical protein n=1 Tax=Derxia lacustris TaxID=764842 RepID=UPI00111C734D|nr:hypothetical protein [Derxia lacustris]